MRDLFVTLAVFSVIAIMLICLPFTCIYLFGAKYEAVKREIFHESKEYQDGIIQQVDKMHLEYIKSKDEAVKAALLKRARRMCAEFDTNNLPTDLKEWIAQ